MKRSISASKREAETSIEKGRRQISQDAGGLSEDYNASVRTGNISPNHGGNKAVWDTVGTNASHPELGTLPKFEPIGEWHFGKDGAPVMGLKSKVADEKSAPSKSK